MNKQKRILSNKGFSHIELLILIIVVLAIGGVGWYIAKHGSTSQANSYSYSSIMGTQPPFTVAKNGFSASGAKFTACKTITYGSGYTYYTVHAKAVLSPTTTNTHYVFVLADTGRYIVNNSTPNASDEWSGGTAYLSGPPANSDVANSIQLSVDYVAPSGFVTPTTMVAPLRAGLINNC